jgi:hypothetical protein
VDRPDDHQDGVRYESALAPHSVAAMVAEASLDVPLDFAPDISSNKLRAKAAALDVVM